MKNLEELIKYLKTGKEIVNLENTNMERCGNEVYTDGDFDEFISSLGATIVFDCKGFIIIADNVATILVKVRNEPNRHDSTLPEETIINFNTLIYIMKNNKIKINEDIQHIIEMYYMQNGIPAATTITKSDLELLSASICISKYDVVKTLGCFEECKDDIKKNYPELYYCLLAVKDDCKGIKGVL